MSTIDRSDAPPDRTVAASDPRVLATAVRALVIDTIERAGSGHPGMPLGMADVATVLFRDHLRFDPAAPGWPDRDRFVLSTGHGSALLYTLAHLTGYDVSLEDLRRFRQLGSATAGHPEWGHCPGVEMTTGPLGQGIATAVGMALAEQLHQARFGEELVDHRTWVIAGDGCLMEGISHEAIDLAGHLGLAKLTVLFDDNGISIDGATALSTSTDQLARFVAAGWDVRSIDGHDPAQIDAALTWAVTTARPTLIACRTTIGFGSPNRAGTSGVHGSPLGATEADATRRALGWAHPPFEVPSEIVEAWREAGRRGGVARTAWERRIEGSEHATSFTASLAPELPVSADAMLAALQVDFAESRPALATRIASQQVLEQLVSGWPELLGGSADLSGSNGTLTTHHRAVTSTDRTGNYVHYGVREHLMAAAMNGLALHGGFVPYGGGFLVFADYCRPAIRLAALMGVRVIHVMTHDSIGLGEDGPTHQPVEHLASLRVMPNLRVYRPADACETAAAWADALSHTTGPSVICLTRQAVATVTDGSGVARGAYVVHGGPRRDVTLLATGSEVSLAVEAAELLARLGVEAAVVSMPCWERFEELPAHERDDVLGETPRVGVEAAIRFGWDRWLRAGDEFVGMTGFGASGPAPELYEHFGITPKAVAAAARRAIAANRTTPRGADR